MSRYNNAIGVSFNDNSGKIGSFVDSAGVADMNFLYWRHGKWKARFLLLKYYTKAILCFERSLLKKGN